MNSKGQRRTHLCVTATTTAIIAGYACSHASASQTHNLKHGETVEALGRQYHVAVKDILSLNHLAASDILRDGRSLLIPDSPRPTMVPETMHRAARIKSDRVSVRVGPGAFQHRVTVCAEGDRLAVTAEKDGWAQVALQNGRSGWIRLDFVKYTENSRNLVKNAPRGKKRSGAARSAATAAVNAVRKRMLSSRLETTKRIVRTEHAEHHSSRESSARIREQHDLVARARLEHHAEAVAAAHRRQHQEQAAAAKHKKHHQEEIAAANHKKHHLEEIAAAKHNRRHEDQAAAHRHHLDEIAQARHHHHLAEIAAAKRHHPSKDTAQARQHRHHEELASAHYRAHLENIAAHQRAHLANLAAHHRAHLANIAATHKRHLAEIAVRNRRHEEHMRRHSELASRHSEQGHLAHHIRPEAESPSASTDVVRAAYAYRGTPYRWGQSRPGGFDCSGFTKYVYGRKGVSLPRTAAEQFHAGNAVEHHNMKPGDLVFFHTTRSGISHVGMYVGNGKFVHSSSKKSGGVRVDNLDSGYYNKAFRGARRVQKSTTEGSGE